MTESLTSKTRLLETLRKRDEEEQAITCQPPPYSIYGLAADEIERLNGMLDDMVRFNNSQVKDFERRLHENNEHIVELQKKLVRERRAAVPPVDVDAKELAEWRRLRADRQAAHLACLRGVIALHPDDALHIGGTSRNELENLRATVTKEACPLPHDHFGPCAPGETSATPIPCKDCDDVVWCSRMSGRCKKAVSEDARL
jgi:hypothetical protein